MLPSRLTRPDIIVRDTTVANIANAFSRLGLCLRRPTPSPQLVFVRHATHAAQGRANGPKDSAGRRLGAKKTASEYVIPGNIIFKQRGTKWFPGENVGIGKDHTIYATVAGYVRYYRNPTVHPKRRYIGVALEKDGPGSTLPSPTNAPTRRRLGMFAAPIEHRDQQFLEAHLSTDSKTLNTKEGEAANPAYRPGTYWVSNYEIGKAAERKGIQVRDFDRKDRWLAWRKRSKKVKEQMLAKAAKATRKPKGKKSNKGPVRRK